MTSNNQGLALLGCALQHFIGHGGVVEHDLPLHKRGRGESPAPCVVGFGGAR